MLLWSRCTRTNLWVFPSTSKTSLGNPCGNLASPTKPLMYQPQWITRFLFCHFCLLHFQSELSVKRQQRAHWLQIWRSPGSSWGALRRLAFNVSLVYLNIGFSLLCFLPQHADHDSQVQHNPLMKKRGKGGYLRLTSCYVGFNRAWCQCAAPSSEPRTKCFVSSL